MFKVIVHALVFKDMHQKHIPHKFINNLKVKNILCLDGLLYFVEGSGLGSEFGFPRV